MFTFSGSLGTWYSSVQRILGSSSILIVLLQIVLALIIFVRCPAGSFCNSSG